jgi:MoaA/NifB/PqqE/SkfB family radical SAM enzyme
MSGADNIQRFNNADRVSRIIYRLKSYGKISLHMIGNGIPVTDVVRSQFPLTCPDPKRPVLMSIEITNWCNLRCNYCTNHLGLRERGFMEENIFRSVIDGIKRLGVRRVRAVGNGEPTLHPRFAEYITRLADATPYLQFLSNGQWQQPEPIIRTLLEARIPLIEFTVEGMDADSYENSRIGGSFSRLLENIRLLKAERDRRGSKSIINLRLMIRPSHRNREKDIKRFWRRYADTVMPQKVFVQKMVDNFDDLYLPVQMEDHSYPVCALPFNSMEVNWNGDVPLCYNSMVQYKPPGFMIGNLGTDSLDDIWNGDILRQYRRAQHKRIKDMMPLCRGCTGV